jgi:hypothetical protein
MARAEENWVLATPLLERGVMDDYDVVVANAEMSEAQKRTVATAAA